MPVAHQDLLDLLEFDVHAVLAGFPLDGVLSRPFLTADEREPKELESLRFAKPFLLSSVRRIAAKL